MKTSSGEGTASLDKALDVLDAISEAPQGLSQADLSALLNVPRTTLYRLLATLVARGFIRRDAQRRVYRLGFKCFELARRAHLNPDLVAAASIELRSLRDLTGETTYLAVLDGCEVLSLERYDGAHSQRSSAMLGQRKPLHCTSQGKAILSALDELARDAIIRDITLKALTPMTITDRRRLQSEVRITAARGWSIDDEEIALGVRCVGAPIVDASGQVRGAISVAGPAWRMTMARVQGLGPEVREAARRIGAQVGLDQATKNACVATPVDGPWAFHGDFPHWLPERGALVWADTLAPAIRLFDGRTDRQLAVLDMPVLGLVPWHTGLLTITEQGYRLIGFDPGAEQVGPLNPLGDLLPRALCVDAQGQLWACIQGESSHGNRWRIGRWSPGTMMQATWLINEPLDALAWDAAGQNLYGIAQESGAIVLLQPGRTVLRRLTTVPKGSGRLAGLCVDGNAGVWTALQDGWSAVRFGPDGTQDRMISLPVPVPTGVAMGQDASLGASLFVTTARPPMSVEALANAPLSGRLFAIAID